MEKLNINIYSCQFNHEDSIPNNVEYVFQGVYLHGALEKEIGYDLTYINKKTEEQFNSKKIEEGKYFVTIIDSFKKIKYNNCILYYWYDTTVINGSHWNRGLICFPDDKEGIKEAEKKFNNRTQIL